MASTRFSTFHCHTKNFASSAIKSPNSVYRVRFMPNRATIVTSAQVGPYRSEAQRLVLRDKTLAGKYRVWHNGGGLVHEDAHIHPNAFVGLSAIVDENGWLGKYAVVDGHAQVDGVVVHEGHVSGNAVLEAGSRVQDYGVVRGDAFLMAGSCVGGHVQVGGNSVLGHNVKVGGGFTICMDSHDVVIEDFVYVLGSNIAISNVKQIKALERAMKEQKK